MPTPPPSAGEQARQEPAPPPPSFLDARVVLAASFLAGEGIEIGPLHQPLALPPQARARHVDRMSVEDLRREYPELAEWDLTRVDVIDDGEELATVADGSQDFIVANHFLEHCEDPIGTVKTHLSKLKPGGVLFYAVPDKRYTFDFRREVTPLEHMVADHEQGPQRSRRQHYEEWGRLVETKPGETEAEQIARADQLEGQQYSIHMHVWTQAEFLQLIVACRERFGEAFEVEAAAQHGIEFVVVLRKAGPPPPPLATDFSPPRPSLPRRAFAKGRREIRTLLGRRRTAS